MPSLEELGIDKATVQEMYERWKAGAKKSQLERDYLSKPESHGKLFTSLVREHLGVETERSSDQTRRLHRLETENRMLREVLTRHGIPIPDLLTD
jgi:hypothetical protein